MYMICKNVFLEKYMSLANGTSDSEIEKKTVSGKYWTKNTTTILRAGPRTISMIVSNGIRSED